MRYIGTKPNAVRDTGNVMEAIAAASTTTFPFLYVYDEEDCDREISWTSRAEKTFQELDNLIISTGSNPDTLISDDTFAAVDVMVATAPRLQPSSRGRWMTKRWRGI